MAAVAASIRRCIAATETRRRRVRRERPGGADRLVGFSELLTVALGPGPLYGFMNFCYAPGPKSQLPPAVSSI